MVASMTKSRSRCFRTATCLQVKVQLESHALLAVFGKWAGHSQIGMQCLNCIESYTYCEVSERGRCYVKLELRGGRSRAGDG